MKNTINRILNYALYILFCLMIGTGCVLHFRLPPRSGRASMLGWTRHEWGEIHTWIAYAFILLIVIHLVMHRVWLIKIASSRHAWKLWGGLLVGVLLIAFFAVYPVVR
jgi:hypothetical protein